MRAMKLLMGIVLVTVTTLGCGVRGRPYPYTREVIGYDEPWIAFREPPKLVELEHGLYVVHDHFAAVYYTEGRYWLYHQGIWYRATSWNSAWTPVHVDLVPGRIAYREHAHYVRYRPDDAVVQRAPAR